MKKILNEETLICPPGKSCQNLGIYHVTLVQNLFHNISDNLNDEELRQKENKEETEYYASSGRPKSTKATGSGPSKVSGAKRVETSNSSHPSSVLDDETVEALKSLPETESATETISAVSAMVSSMVDGTVMSKWEKELAEKEAAILQASGILTITQFWYPSYFFCKLLFLHCENEE